MQPLLKKIAHYYKKVPISKNEGSSKSRNKNTKCQLQNYLDHFATVMILLGRSNTDNGKARFLTFPACF